MTSSQRAETSARATGPREVNDVIDAVRAFTDTVERVGPEEFGQAAAQLRKAELAWVIDRLDDVRQAVATVLEELAEPVEQYGADVNDWHETLGALGAAGDGLYAAMREIDPGYDRWDLSGEQYPLGTTTDERR